MEPDLNLVGGPVPIDRHVSEEKAHRHGGPGKRKARPFSNDAVRAFATDEKLRGNRLLCSLLRADARPDAIAILVEADQFAAPLHRAAARRENALQDFLGIALRNDEQPRLTGLAPGL